MTTETSEAQPTACLPKGPFTFLSTAREGKHLGSGAMFVLDANGRKVATVWGSPEEKVELAALMIEARDRVP
jgi:hypothetical protein